MKRYIATYTIKTASEVFITIPASFVCVEEWYEKEFIRDFMRSLRIEVEYKETTNE